MTNVEGKVPLDLPENWSEVEKKLQELDTALYDAGAMVLRMRDRGLEQRQKSQNNTDFVTPADIASEKQLTTAVRAIFPDHAIEGEEGTDEAGASALKWYLDPIDGTKPYSEGGSFGISAGLSYRGEPVYGVIYYPAESKLVKASRGLGATLNGAP